MKINGAEFLFLPLKVQNIKFIHLTWIHFTIDPVIYCKQFDNLNSEWWYPNYVFNTTIGKNEAHFRQTIEREIIEKIERSQKQFKSNPTKSLNIEEDEDDV